jgi:hypothetical protein
MAERIVSYKDLRVYQNAMEAAMKIFQLTRSFPLLSQLVRMIDESTKWLIR